MLTVLIYLYATIGITAALTHLGRFILKSNILAIPFMPFMVIYFLVFGDKKRRYEAIMICKGLLVLCILFLAIYLIMYLILI